MPASVPSDCDRDTLLVRVEQVGAACHTGARSCFEAALPAATASSAGVPNGAGSSAGGSSAGPRPDGGAGP